MRGRVQAVQAGGVHGGELVGSGGQVVEALAGGLVWADGNVGVQTRRGHVGSVSGELGIYVGKGTGWR